MRPFEVGLVLPMGDTFVDGETVRWVEIRDLALRAEELLVWPTTIAALDAMAPVLELLDAGQGPPVSTPGDRGRTGNR